MRYELKKSAASRNFSGVKKPSITGTTRLETQPTAINLRWALDGAPIFMSNWKETSTW